MRLLLVYNPNARMAGRCSPKLLEEELRRLGAQVEVVVSAEEEVARDATRKAVAEGVDRVVVAGGDGTVSAAIDALAGKQTPLAVIPLGTGNVLAEEAGLKPGAWQAACKVAVEGQQVVRIDLGKAADRYFATMFGAGLDAQVVADISQLHKRNYGRWAFVRQLFVTSARYRMRQFFLEVDGQPIGAVGWVAIVSNTPRYAWRMHFSPQARADDGVLDLCVFSPRTRGRMLLEGVATFLLQRPALSSPLTARFRRLRVECEPRAWWQADGELGGRTPVEVEVVPAALSVVVGSHQCRLAKAVRATDPQPAAQHGKQGAAG